MTAYSTQGAMEELARRIDYALTRIDELEEAHRKLTRDSAKEIVSLMSRVAELEEDE